MAQLIPELKKYLRPASLGEYVKYEQKHRGRYKLLAGGTSMAFSRPRDSVVIDLSGLPLNEIRTLKNGDLELGAMATVFDLESSESVLHYAGGMLPAACDRLASTPLRNLITLGGNIMGGYAWSDLPVAFLALDAEIIAFSGNERRRPLVEDQRMNRAELLREGEILTAVILPGHRRDAAGAFIKTGKTQVDFSLATTALSFYLQDGLIRDMRVAIGGITAQPRRMPEIEALLEGEAPSRDVIERAARELTSSVTPRPDSRATAEYRLNLLKIQFGRAVEQALKGTAS